MFNHEREDLNNYNKEQLMNIIMDYAEEERKLYNIIGGLNDKLESQYMNINGFLYKEEQLNNYINNLEQENKRQQKKINELQNKLIDYMTTEQLKEEIAKKIENINNMNKKE